MHETPVVEALLERALREARGEERVTQVELAVGELASHSLEALSFHFELAACGTVAEGARLEALRDEARLLCSGCGRSMALGTTDELSCPSCGGPLEAVGVREVRLMALELRDGASGRVRAVCMSQGVKLG